MDRSSLTVKPYIYKSVNILRRNRRAVCVVASDKVPGLKVAMVIVGGITVDSIRLSFISCMGDGSGGELPPQSKAKGREQKEDAGPLYLRKGQEIGSFARGGSAVALLFTRSMELATERAVGAIAAGMDFKIGVGDDLAVLARRES
jgi:phosphatidylserine decarboxylase